MLVIRKFTARAPLPVTRLATRPDPRDALPYHPRIGSDHRFSLSKFGLSGTTLPLSRHFTLAGLVRHKRGEGTDMDSDILAGKRALIAEDEGVVVLHYRKLLAAAGVLVVGAATNARDAINLALRERPDLILMDVNMPGELDGLAAAQVILAHFPVCIVMVTAYDDEEYRRKAADIPASGYVVKPVVASTLVPELREALWQWKQAA